jgi:hypothetical protein
VFRVAVIDITISSHFFHFTVFSAPQHQALSASFVVSLVALSEIGAMTPFYRSAEHYNRAKSAGVTGTQHAKVLHTKQRCAEIIKGRQNAENPSDRSTIKTLCLNDAQMMSAIYAITKRGMKPNEYNTLAISQVYIKRESLMAAFKVAKEDGSLRTTADSRKPVLSTKYFEAVENVFDAYASIGDGRVHASQIHEEMKNKQNLHFRPNWILSLFYEPGGISLFSDQLAVRPVSSEHGVIEFAGRYSTLATISSKPAWTAFHRDERTQLALMASQAKMNEMNARTLNGALNTINKATDASKMLAVQPWPMPTLSMEPSTISSEQTRSCGLRTRK